jgi:hypothetical protein
MFGHSLFTNFTRWMRQSYSLGGFCDCKTLGAGVLKNALDCVVGINNTFATFSCQDQRVNLFADSNCTTSVGTAPFSALNLTVGTCSNGVLVQCETLYQVFGDNASSSVPIRVLSVVMLLISVFYV